MFFRISKHLKPFIEKFSQIPNEQCSFHATLKNKRFTTVLEGLRVNSWNLEIFLVFQIIHISRWNHFELKSWMALRNVQIRLQIHRKHLQNAPSVFIWELAKNFNERLGCLKIRKNTLSHSIYRCISVREHLRCPVRKSVTVFNKPSEVPKHRKKTLSCLIY